jgi:glutamate carboxypeptidase
MLNWLQNQRESMVGLLREMVEQESPSTNKEAVDRFGVNLTSLFEDIGAVVRTIEVEEFGNHLLAEWGGPSSDQVLVIGHLDTVWELGTLETMPFRLDGGRAYGPGTFDMKGGLVQLLFALRALAETGRRPRSKLAALINSDEEVGSSTSRSLIEEQARKSRTVLVLEPSLSPGGRLKTFRKGVGVFHLAVEGRAAHAGLDPRGGASAIEELSRQVQRLHAMTDYDRGTTVNVGTVSGGTRVNVVAAQAEAEIDLRVSTMEDARAMEKAILGLQATLEGTRVRVTGGVDRPPLERTPAVVALYHRARDIAQDLGFDLGEGAAGGGSDGNLTAACGVPTLDGMGAVGDGAHAVHEHVIVDEMPKRAALLAGLLEVL